MHASATLLRRAPAAFAAAMIVAAGCATPLEPRPFATQIRIDAGAIAGAMSSDVLSFKGIPYAAPPIGTLRWRAPQPAPGWSDVRQTVEYGHDCTQLAVQDEAAPLGTSLSEDCLVLNVWRPARGTPIDRLPVLVWIHGGGYLNGGSSTPVFDGASLARHGLVVVTFNYRLGRLGFFAHPSLIAAKEGPVGNFGYMDQIAALRWVQTNVAAFGGDAAHVTVAGESAGGASILHLMTSPVTAGLFHRAIVMSGGGRRALASRRMTGGTAEDPSADQMDEAFAEKVGVKGTGPTTLAALRALPAGAAFGDLSLPAMLRQALTTGAQSFGGTPMIDGTIVVEQPEDAFKHGTERKIPMLIGTTALDLPLFFPSRADPLSYFGSHAAEARTAFNPDGTDPAPAVLLGLSSDLTVHEPARFAARTMTMAGVPAWLYRFTYVAQRLTERTRGAAHAQDVPYLFDTLDERYGPSVGVTESDRSMARTFSAYIANFAIAGDPNGANLPRWPTFDPARYDLMNFTLDRGPLFGIDPRADRLALIEQVASTARRE